MRQFRFEIFELGNEPRVVRVDTEYLAIACLRFTFDAHQPIPQLVLQKQLLLAIQAPVERLEQPVFADDDGRCRQRAQDSPYSGRATNAPLFSLQIMRINAEKRILVKGG